MLPVSGNLSAHNNHYNVTLIRKAAVCRVLQSVHDTKSSCCDLDIEYWAVGTEHLTFTSEVSLETYKLEFPPKSTGQHHQDRKNSCWLRNQRKFETS
jgi:hypothetical protein